MAVEAGDGHALAGLFGTYASTELFGTYASTASGLSEFCTTYAHLTAKINQYNAANPPEVIDFPQLLNSSVKFAQAAGLLACLLGFAATALLFLSFFLQSLLTKCTSRIVLPVLLNLAGLLQILTFVAADQWCTCPDILQGVNCPVITCTVSDGGNRAIAATVLYLFVGVAMIFYPRRTTPLFDLSATAPDGENKEAFVPAPIPEEQASAPVPRVHGREVTKENADYNV